MAKLVACKACNKEIAKGVKKCPSCGKDQRNFFRRHKILTFIGACVLIGVIGSAASGGGSDTASTEPSKQEAKSEIVHKTGETFKTNGGKAEASLIKVEQADTVGNQYGNKKVSDGGTFVAIQYTIKNVSKKPIGAFSLPSATLEDQEGTSYDSDIDASSYYAVAKDIDNSKFMSDLNPNILVTNTMVFEISKDAYAKGKWYVVIDGEKVQVK